MGGAMTYRRFLRRNRLETGDYDPNTTEAPLPVGILRGDLRRFERDLLEVYAERWAADLALAETDVRRVLDKVLDEP